MSAPVCWATRRPVRRCSSERECRPPLPRPREKITEVPLRLRRQPRVATGGAMAVSSSHGVGELVHYLELCPFHPLDDKLSDPVTTGNLRRPGGVMVDQVDHDLAPVP